MVPGPELTLLVALAVHLSAESESCKMWPSKGAVVQRGSSFQMFCTSQRHSDFHTPAVYENETLRKHTRLNSSTVYIDVVNITANTVYGCQCTSGEVSAREPCGFDVLTGYPPDRPGDVSCIQHVTDGQLGIVVCRWNSGTKTYIHTTTWVTSLSGKHNSTPDNPNSASWSEASSIQQISVKVFAHNELGSAQSDTHNFTLRDIVKPSPPILILEECSSRSCNITCRSPQTHTEVQYIPALKTHTNETPEHECIPRPGMDWQTSSSGLPSVRPLEPYNQYCFRARAKQSSGLWSDWSKAVSKRTQEEAPDQRLDAWFSRSKVNTLTVYWKALGVYEVRGQLLGYRVQIKDNVTGKLTNYTVGARDTHLALQSCGTCLVTVSAYNSIGSSPQTLLPTLETAPPPQDLDVIESKDNVSLSWRKTDSVLQSTGYLVEWYLQGQQLETLQWMRLSSAKNQATITDMQQYECYDGALYVLYERTVGKSSFTAVNTLVSVPTGAPSVTKQVGGAAVTVTWNHLPRGQRRGCVRNYSVYIENYKDTKDKRIYHVPASESQFTVDRLPPATYRVWMTAWTQGGQGPSGSSVKFIIQEESYSIPLVFITIGGIMVVLLMLKLMRCQRLKRIRCFLPDVPDPSNSNWAKAFSDNKGKMALDIYPADVSSEEEEHIVTLFEQPKGNDEDLSEGVTYVSSVRRPELDSGMTQTQTPYIKSLSQDTHGSHDTSAGYMSQVEESGGGGGEREEEEEEEEEECTDFSPWNIFDSPQEVLGGMLTLDAVKIDCRNVWENGL